MLRRKNISLAVGIACALLSGLTYAQESKQSPEESTAEVLPVINVTGLVDATSEGTGSYGASAITVGSKIPQTIRETPFSVSVITRQRLTDQNFTKIEDALKQTTGITVQRFDGAGNFNTIQSRGFAVGSVQLDGIPISQDGNYATGFDTAIYDRIEMLRGPAGLLQGAGEPGGTVNLVRKRALSSFGGSAGASIGSWNARRVDVDVTNKLNESGTVRGRIVGVVDKRDSFVDVVNSDKSVLYGTLEVDLSPQTTLSIGSTYQEVDSLLDQGLPTYTNGQLLNVSRSTFAGTASNIQNTKNKDTFAELEHRLDNGGLFKITGRQIDRSMYYYGGRSASAVGNASLPADTIELQTVGYKRATQNRNLDAYLTSPFEWGGQTHTFLLGASYATEDADSVNRSLGLSAAERLNIFNPNNSLALRPVVLGPYDSFSELTQKGIYGQVQLKPTDRWTVLAGGRFSRYELSTRNTTTGAAQKISPESQFTPLVGAIYKLDERSSLYMSYAETFVAQTALTVAGGALPPRTGSQIEVGIKSEWLDKRVNTHLALFRIIDDGRAITDPSNPTFSIAGGKVKSQGLEAEISGQIAPGWEMAAGYAYTDLTVLRAAANSTFTTFNSATPKHNVNLWSKFSWQDSAYGRWSIGGGFRIMSEIYDLTNNIRVTQEGYALANAQIAYQFDPKTTLSLTATNLFDKKYYEKVGSASFGRQSFYGEPRALTLALRKTF